MRLKFPNLALACNRASKNSRKYSKSIFRWKKDSAVTQEQKNNRFHRKKIIKCIVLIVKPGTSQIYFICKCKPTQMNNLKCLIILEQNFQMILHAWIKFLDTVLNIAYKLKLNKEEQPKPKQKKSKSKRYLHKKSFGMI